MRRLSAVVVLCLLAAMSVSTWASTKTTTLSVPGMTCPVCPLTLKTALGKINGVSKVAVDFDRKEATVTYDDAKTNVDALCSAAADAGLPGRGRLLAGVAIAVYAGAYERGFGIA